MEEKIMAVPAIRNSMAPRSLRTIKEQVITSIWFLCAIFAILVVCFILGYLFINGYPAFLEIDFSNFLLLKCQNYIGTKCC